MTPDQAAEAVASALATAKEYADLVVRPPLEQLGGLLSDQMGHWRRCNQVRLMLKLKAYIEQKGLKPEKLLPSVFVPLMEEAANTDDETLSDMFARLLATHVDENRQHAAHPSFAKILGQLSPLDVKVLNLLDRKEQHEDQGSKITSWDQTALIREAKTGISDDIKAGQVVLSFNNLERLGLCRCDYPIFEQQLYSQEPASPAGARLTEFGAEFLIACNDPDTYWRACVLDPSEFLYQVVVEAQQQQARDGIRQDVT